MRKTLYQLCLLPIFLFYSQLISAQSLVGLWEVKSVRVGSELMTPIAKWSMFNADGSYTSGNGWLQNSAGTWQLNEVDNSLSMNETHGLKDEFGAFSSPSKWG